MQATRTRPILSPDWWTLPALCAATCIVGLLAIRELRVAPQAFASSQVAAPSIGASASVPPEAVSIPTLVVAGEDLRVGDAADAAIVRLSGSATLVASAAERGPLGPRQVRSYRLDGSNVFIVLEPFEKQGPSRVAAIYLR